MLNIRKHSQSMLRQDRNPRELCAPLGGLTSGMGYTDSSGRVNRSFTATSYCFRITARLREDYCNHPSRVSCLPIRGDFFLPLQFLDDAKRNGFATRRPNRIVMRKSLTTGDKHERQRTEIFLRSRKGPGCG